MGRLEQALPLGRLAGGLGVGQSPTMNAVIFQPFFCSKVAR
jgi:hypothetical protein